MLFLKAILNQYKLLPSFDLIKNLNSPPPLRKDHFFPVNPMIAHYNMEFYYGSYIENFIHVK